MVYAANASVPTYHHGYINTVKHCGRFPSFENLCTTRVAFVLCGTCRCVRPGLTVRTRCSVHADDMRAHSIHFASMIPGHNIAPANFVVIKFSLLKLSTVVYLVEDRLLGIWLPASMFYNIIIISFKDVDRNRIIPQPV